MIAGGVSRHLAVMAASVLGAVTMVMSSAAVGAQEPVPVPDAEVVPGSAVPDPVPVVEGDDAEAVVALSGIVEIAGGAWHTCARLAGGTAKCWGYNQQGQLGAGDGVDRLVPVTVRNPAGTGPLTGIVEIDAGQVHTCARLSDGTAQCWGYNGYGGLGNGGSSWLNPLPAPVRNPSGTGPLTGIVEIAAGIHSTCARLTDGTVRCWGANAYGQIGDGTTVDRYLPVTVKNPAGTGPLTGTKAIATGGLHTCARLVDSTVRCWGHNAWGAVGDGTTTNRLRPVTVKNPSGTGPLTGVSSLASGAAGHTCAAMTDRTARCWGYNGYGELGDGTRTRRLRPVIVKGASGVGSLTGVTTVRTGSSHSCSHLSDGTARCWGYNGEGSIGDGTAGVDRLLPVAVKNPAGTGPLTGVTDLATGWLHSCAVLADSTARCWGSNTRGQLGNGSTVDRKLPVTVKRGT